MLLINKQQMATLGVHSFSLLVHKMRLSLSNNGLIDHETAIEINQLTAEMQHAMSRYRIIREDLLEEYLHLLYQFPHHMRGCLPQSSVGSILFSRTKSEVLKIDELNGLLITYGV